MTDSPIGILYTKEMIADDQILCYRFNDTNKTTIDPWLEDVMDELVNWPEDKPWRMILDVTMQGAVVSAYSMRNARMASSTRPEMPGRMAVLVGSTVAMRLINVAILNSRNHFRQRKVFVNEAEAIEWLLEGTETQKSRMG